MITGDLVGSSKLLDRGKVQTQVRSTLHKMNRAFRQDIVVGFAFSGGDEFQGLVKLGDKVFAMIKEFQKQLYPVKVYFGIGYGEISTPIAKTTVEMDGECFHHSRKAVEYAKKLHQEIVFITGNEEKDAILNTVLQLISALKSSWKDIHYRRIWKYEKLNTLEQVAEKEAVSLRAVSKTLQDAKYDAIRNAEEFICQELTLKRN